LFVGNVTVFLAPAISYEILMAATILMLGVLCGVYRFSIKIMVFYTGVILIQVVGDLYFPNGIRILVVTFAIFVRKIFPCVMLGGILVSTTRVNEFMSAMNRIHMPKNVLVPLTVMLRYFPMVSEEWVHIKNAMKMRDVSPTLLGFIKNPGQTVECIYVPLLMSASKIADELSIASVTRGIENPKPRTCLQQIKFHTADALCTIYFAALLGLVFFV
jgi:energy-coupling factor transport system permease protein